MKSKQIKMVQLNDDDLFEYETSEYSWNDNSKNKEEEDDEDMDEPDAAWEEYIKRSNTLPINEDATDTSDVESDYASDEE